jgi:hypothetical protein
MANLRAATGAFVREVDLCHAPVRLDVAHKHRKPDAARTDDEGRFDMIVLEDVGWHLGSPQIIQESIRRKSLTRRGAYASCE